jgi:copper oxidase (laccase) domain-containing protein
MMALHAGWRGLLTFLAVLCALTRAGKMTARIAKAIGRRNRIGSIAAS